MKLLAIIGISLLIIVIGVQVFSLLRQEHGLSQTLSDMQTSLTKAQAQEVDLSAEVQYLANPANLEKELRARFNYKNPGETMVVIVPSTPTSTGQ